MWILGGMGGIVRGKVGSEFRKGNVRTLSNPQQISKEETKKGYSWGDYDGVSDYIPLYVLVLGFWAKIMEEKA